MQKTSLYFGVSPLIEGQGDAEPYSPSDLGYVTDEEWQSPSIQSETPYDPFGVTTNVSPTFPDRIPVSRLFNVAQIVAINPEGIPYQVIFSSVFGKPVQPMINVDSLQSPLLSITGYPGEIVHFKAEDIETEKYSFVDLNGKMIRLTIQPTHIAVRIMERRAFTPPPVITV